jgi:hypothetical protein
MRRERFGAVVMLAALFLAFALVWAATSADLEKAVERVSVSEV